jgi:CheY-like chemotaxis protein/DNA-directed RNA polymerase specialized sigma24 family protein
MSLGQEIAPHIPFLRRHARALTGSQATGDSFVREVLEGIVAKPSIVDRTDVRLSIYRLFHDYVGRADAADLSSPGGGAASDEGNGRKISHQRLAKLKLSSRAALLLTAMEGFTPGDAAYILRSDVPTIEREVAEALAEIDRQTRAAVLIIEDEPIIAMDLESIVRDLGHKVVGLATTRAEAVRQALDLQPGLILADIQLADDSSGIDAVREIMSHRQVPAIFITAFPERLMTGERPEPTFLITKPFQRSTVKSAIAQALFFDAATLPPEEDTAAVNEEQPRSEPIPAATVAARLGPVNASVRGQRLRLVEDNITPARLDGDALDAVRRLHYATVRRLCGELVGSNVGSAFNARLEAIRRTLSKRLSRERCLQLSVQARGLEGMLPAISERLDDVTAADVIVFISDLGDTVRQFPIHREFAEEADALPISDEAADAAIQLATNLENQLPEVVEPELQAAIADIRKAAEDQPSQLSRLALVRTVGNVFRAMGRAINRGSAAVGARAKAISSRRVAGVSKHAADNFDETLGRWIGKGLAGIVASAVTWGALNILAAALPSEFNFALFLIKFAKAVAQLVT